MGVLERIRDAGAAAMHAPYPTDVLLISGGFWIVARSGGGRAGRKVRFDALELSPINPLVEAIVRVNRELKRLERQAELAG